MLHASRLGGLILRQLKNRLTQKRIILRGRHEVIVQNETPNYVLVNEVFNELNHSLK